MEFCGQAESVTDHQQIRKQSPARRTPNQITVTGTEGAGQVRASDSSWAGQVTVLRGSAQVQVVFPTEMQVGIVTILYHKSKSGRRAPAGSAPRSPPAPSPPAKGEETMET